MSQLQQILNYVKNINERLNLWSANAKKTEELPVMVTMDPNGLLIVSELVDGIWTSKQLEIQKIIDGISLSGQDNKVREVLLGTITADHDLNYLLDNTGITVAENEVIILTALATINETLVQKQYLWKLGKGAFNPIGSVNISTKLIELQPRFLNEITADELTSSPSAIVYDFGLITDTIVNVINTANPAYNYTDSEKIYYIRAVKDGVKLLYNFIGINGTYGAVASQMVESDLVLVYSSANTDITALLNNKLDKGSYTGTAHDLDSRILDLELPDGVLKIGVITQSGSTVTVAANEFSVRYNQIEVFNTAFSGTIASATDLYNRIDILEIATTGIIYIKQGVEDLEIAVKPDTTSGRYEIGLININGSTVSPATTSPSGSNYVAKTEFSFNKVTGSGAKSSTSISSDACNFRFTGASQIASILVSTNNKKYIYEGKDHFVKNENGTTLIIKHNSGTGNFKYNFPNATDLVIQNNEIIHFKFRFTTGNAGFLDYVGVIYDKSRVGLSNVDNTSDLNKPISTAQQLAFDLKLDASAYNDRFKGVYLTLSALNSAHPTANVGDYAQVNEVGASDVVNYNWDAEENIWVKNEVAGSGATNTDELPEGTTNLYFTGARVLATLLSGLSVATGGAIVSTDSVLIAFGKIQKQINDISTTLSGKQNTLVAGTNISIDNTNPLAPVINASAGGGGYIVSKNAWVSSTGNDTTGLIGREDLSFLTVNAALDALGVNGGIVNIGLGSFNSPLYSKIKSNTVFKGSGKPKYNNTITGGTSYPLYTKTTATALVGGTIFLGEFRIPFDSENIQIYDLGVDSGLDWCTAFNSGVATDGFMISNGNYANTSQSGKLMRKNIIVKNISIIVKSPTDSVHCFAIENCYEPYVDNIDTYNGFAGFVYKNIGGTALNIKAKNAGDFGINIKTNTYAYNNSVSLNGFEIDGGAGLVLQDEGDASGLQNVYISNGRIRNCSFGVKQIGFLIKYANFSNVFVSSISGLGFDFSNVQDSNFINNSATSCTSGGFKIAGINNRMSENRATSNTGVGIDLRTTSGTFVSISTGNNADNNSTYGFFYSGDIRGGHNVAINNTTAPVSGTITILDAYALPNPLVLSGAPDSYTAPLSVENTGTASAADKNVAVFSGNRGSSTSSDDNTTIGIRQKNATVKNYSIFSFWNSAFNTVAQIAVRNISHGLSEGSLAIITTLDGVLKVTLVASSNGNVLIGKDQFTGATNNDNGAKLQVEGIAYLKTYTVGTLPTPTTTAYATVTDALAPTYMATVVGGGAVVTPVFYNGTNWVAH